MKLPRPFWRRMMGGIAACAIVFAQLALSAYACPLEAPSSAGAQAARPCEEVDLDQPGLCQRHCEDSRQAVKSGADPAPTFVYLAALVVPLAEGGLLPPVVTAAPHFLAHASSPPLAIRHCCLRI